MLIRGGESFFRKQEILDQGQKFKDQSNLTVRIKYCTFIRGVKIKSVVIDMVVFQPP